MVKKCLYCRSTIVGYANKKYCNDVCRSLNWKAQKRLKKKREYNRTLIDRSEITIAPEVQELYKKIFGN